MGARYILALISLVGSMGEETSSQFKLMADTEKEILEQRFIEAISNAESLENTKRILDNPAFARIRVDKRLRLFAENASFFPDSDVFRGRGYTAVIRALSENPKFTKNVADRIASRVLDKARKQNGHSYFRAAKSFIDTLFSEDMIDRGGETTKLLYRYCSYKREDLWKFRRWAWTLVPQMELSDSHLAVLAKERKGSRRRNRNSEIKALLEHPGLSENSWIAIAERDYYTAVGVLSKRPELMRAPGVRKFLYEHYYNHMAIPALIMGSDDKEEIKELFSDLVRKNKSETSLLLDRMTDEQLAALEAEDLVPLLKSDKSKVRLKAGIIIGRLRELEVQAAKEAGAHKTPASDQGKQSQRSRH